MVKIVCNVCGSANIEQEASIMINPNKEIRGWNLGHSDFMWQDYYWCKECADETTIHEVGPGISWDAQLQQDRREKK